MQKYILVKEKFQKTLKRPKWITFAGEMRWKGIAA